jgi:hypothetical protein
MNVGQLPDDELIKAHQMLVALISLPDMADDRRRRFASAITEVEDEMYARVGKRPGRHLWAVPDVS